MIGSNEKGSGWIDTGHVVSVSVQCASLLWKIHKGVYVPLVQEQSDWKSVERKVRLGDVRVSRSWKRARGAGGLITRKK